MTMTTPPSRTACSPCADDTAGVEAYDTAIGITVVALVLLYLCRLCRKLAVEQPYDDLGQHRAGANEEQNAARGRSERMARALQGQFDLRLRRRCPVLVLDTLDEGRQSHADRNPDSQPYHHHHHQHCDRFPNYRRCFLHVRSGQLDPYC
jgi:hypothetical protein